MQSIEDISRPHTFIYESLFKEMNPRGRDTVPAQEAAAFLKRSNLDVGTLGQIWELSDEHSKGCLDKRGAFIAFKLIALAQQGHAVRKSSITEPISNLNPPIFTKLSQTTARESPQLSSTPSSQSPHQLITSKLQESCHISSNDSLNSTDKWSIGQTDQLKYDSIFDGLQPVDGKVSGDKVRPVLMNSGLPGASLAKIWELSDIDKDGKLDRIEMSIALHLVYNTLKGESIPLILPPALVHPSKVGKQHRMSVVSAQQWSAEARDKSRHSSVTSLDTCGLVGGAKFNINYSDYTNRSQSVQPYSSINAQTSCASLPALESRSQSVGGVWPIETSLYEAQFLKADKNKDGLVSGADIKDDLVATLLPQSVLARLWNLVDIKRNGLFNLEQFALIMYLVDECKKGNAAPMILPPYLVPPSLRFNQQPQFARSDEKLELSGSKELDELEEEVRRLVSERRHADEAIVQLEADMTVKNSEIKNLQIELNTLENTVVQLERQKVEAEKRLKQLDNQINELECIGRELKVKIGEENSRLMNLRNENTLAKENAVKENAEMTKAKEQLRVLEEQEKQLNATLLQRNNVIENSAIQLTKLESEQTASENEIQRVEKENEKLLNIKNRLNYLIETSDIDGIIREQSDLMAFAPVGAGQSGSYGQFGQNEAKMTNASPFDTQIDPFADVQHSVIDPFSDDNPFESSSKSQTQAKSAPPPRPEPPKTKQTFTQNVDPFSQVDPFQSNQDASNTPNQFANFANFDAFPS